MNIYSGTLQLDALLGGAISMQQPRKKKTLHRKKWLKIYLDLTFSIPGLLMPDHTLQLAPLMRPGFPVTRAYSKPEDPELRFDDPAETQIIL